MFFKIISLLLCLSPFPLIGSVKQDSQYVTEETPSWVKTYEFPLEPVSLKPTQVNLQHLLIDTQRNWETKTVYRHYVIKALTQSGIEDISQLHINFDPSTTRVAIHKMQVFRAGKWFDRLANSRSQIIQRETRLEEALYDGNLTVVHFIEDIREGDIIEYSYSLVGENPFFDSHLTDFIYLQREFSVEKIMYRLLAHPELSFEIKPVNTTVEPKISDLSPSLREWEWEAIDPPVYTYESNQPVWHNPLGHIEMSQYKDWEEVAQKIYPLYALPADFTESIPPEMNALVEQWKASTKKASERALLALRFVQDEVRYLGFEESMEAYAPIDPRITFQRRFGDCKNKTHLLHAFLQLLDIQSNHLLVHSSRGKILPLVLPNPDAFDHMILQLEINGITYWVDPTIRLQGGNLETNSFPDYTYGLVISNSTKALTAFPQPTSLYPIEIDTSIILESKDSALLTLKSTFYGSSADHCRRSLKQNGLKKISDNILSDLQKTYGQAEVTSPLEALDDRTSNIFTYIESYHIPTEKLSDKTSLEMYFYSLRYYLDSYVNPERVAPYELRFPLWLKEHIHIENSFFKWDPIDEYYKQEHPSLFYAISTRMSENIVDFDIELKHLQDHVSKDSLKDYWKIVNEIKESAPFKITISDSSVIAPTPSLFPSVFHLVLYLLLWPVIYFLFQEKVPHQGLISFYLSRFRQFNSIFTVLMILFINDSIASAVFSITCLTIFFKVVSNCILARSSKKILSLLQILMVLQALLITDLISSSTDIEPAHRLFALVVCYLYLGTTLVILNKTGSILITPKDWARNRPKQLKTPILH